MGYIYMITNKIDGSIYVGKTVDSIQSRWKDHIYSAYSNVDNFYLHNAIKKYGQENFLVEKLEECENTILSEREIYWIKEKKSFYKDNEKGYNLTRGGDGVTKYSDEELLELWDKNLNLHEISQILNANIGTISKRLQILRPGEALERRTKTNSKEILQYDFEGNFIREWPSTREAARALKIDNSGISRACNKEGFSCGNFLWKWKEDKETTVEELMLNYAKSSKCCSVDLVDENKKIIKTYRSAREAEKQLSLPRGKVSEVCWHKRPHTCNYKFEWHYPLKKELANDF